MIRSLTTPIRAALAVLALVVVAASCTPMGPARTTTVDEVDVGQYLGEWYEIASVKQFFSAGLVNTTADYSLLPSGAIRVENSGNYFFADGPLSTIVGTAVPVDGSNARLNVSFTGSNSAQPPGNYWIIAIDPDYQWSVVSNPSGTALFILSRTPTMDPELKADLLAQAAAAGVDISNVTDTPQPG